MIRLLIFVLSLLYVTNFFGIEGDIRKMMEVQVLSDEFDSAVPEGKCKITGEVYYQGQLRENAEVCSYYGKQCVNTGNKGEFSLLIDTSEVYVYASVIGANPSYLNSYQFLSRHHVKLRFYINNYPIQNSVKKPVIYLYSDRALDLDLKVNTKVDLTFTYPAHQENGWHVSISPENGIVVDNQYYPYLFWEGIDNDKLTYQINDGNIVGEIIRTDTVITYLEKQLTILGLNPIEKTDFITFWAPILSRQRYALVQFKLDEDYNEIAAIESSVPVDNERRIFLMFTSFDWKPNIPVTGNQHKVDRLKRNGLTLIEWGGAAVRVPVL